MYLFLTILEKNSRRKKKKHEDPIEVGGASFELVDLEGYCGSWHLSKNFSSAKCA